MASFAKKGTPQVHRETDLSYCHEALLDLQRYSREFHDLADKTRNPVSKMTFHIVAVFCEGGAGALQAFVDLNLPPESTSPEKWRATSNEHDEWRPGDEPETPLP
jgi:hypothetical protein